MLDGSITPGNASQNGSGFSITMAGPDGGAANLVTTDNTSRDDARGFGVGSSFGRQGGQIAHDPASGRSESLSVSFDTAQTAIAVDVANLFANEGGKTEVGVYTLLDDDGNEVGGGTFAAESGSTVTVEIDPDGGQTFDEVVFTAAPYSPGQGDDTSDSSDYWINEIRFAAAPDGGAGEGEGEDGDAEDGDTDDGDADDVQDDAPEHRTVLIDFEGLTDTAEGDALTDQFADQGVTFETLGSVDRGTPTLVETGGEQGEEAAFVPTDTVTDGTDIGEAFLTGSNALRNSGQTAGFRMNVEGGAWRVAGDLLDLDGGETWTIIGQNAEGEAVASIMLSDEADADGGDGAATPWELAVDSTDDAITTVVFQGDRPDNRDIGFGFDNIAVDVDANSGNRGEAGTGQDDGAGGDTGDDSDGNTGGEDNAGGGGEAGDDGGDTGGGTDGSGENGDNGDGGGSGDAADGGDGDDIGNGGGGNSGVDVDISLVQDFGEGGYIAKAIVTNTGDTRFFDWEAAVDLGDSGAFVTGWSSDINAPITVSGAGGDTGEFGTSDTFRRPIDPGDSFTLHYQSDGGTVDDDSFDFDVLTSETGGTANADDLDAELTIDDWGNGFIANLVVSNNSGGPISDWTVEIDFGDSDVNVTDVWGASADGSGSTVTLTAADFNAAIPEDGRVFAGFVAEDNSVEALQTVVEADSITFL